VNRDAAAVGDPLCEDETPDGTFTNKIAICKRGEIARLAKSFNVAQRAVRQRRFQPHIRRRGEEPRACRRGTRARRWVVERTHSWFNRYRKLLIRWEKKPQNYLALVQFAAVLIVWRLVG
jgi:transposase